jgi:hypothetical protein
MLAGDFSNAEDNPGRCEMARAAEQRGQGNLAGSHSVALLSSHRYAVVA